MNKITTPWGHLGYITYKRCVEKSTLVLCDDFQWREAGELKVGQGLITFDETKEGISRYIRLGKVLHNSVEKASCVGIKLESGQVIYCTPDHSFLVKMAGNDLHWREAKDLQSTKKGGSVYLPKVFGDVWEVDRSYEAGYLAAAFDGEGCHDRTNGMNFVQCDNSMLARVKEYLDLKGISYTHTVKSNPSPETRKDCHSIRFHGFKEMVRFMGELDLTRLKDKFTDYLHREDVQQRMRCSPEDYVKVEEVFEVGQMDVAVLETSTKTHFTAGFPSHNTYARRVEDEGRTEEFPETVDRVLRACDNQLGCGFSAEEQSELRALLLGLKCSVAGRFLWQLGTKTVDQHGLLSLQNCAATVVDNPITPFIWTMDALMLGSGVGYNIQREYVNELPRPKLATVTRKDTTDADFIVPDSREGWVALLRRTLEAHFRGTGNFSYSTILVRSKGAAIKGFGGVASGPEELCWGIGEISKVLNLRAGKKVRPIDCLDIMNIIGYVVVAGNVRRSAQIAIGDMDDLQYLEAKSWENQAKYKWRRMSNNSVVCNDFAHIPEQFWKGYDGTGEPYGLINLRLSRQIGRLGEYEYPDLGVVAYNPCAEQPLHAYETCCLAEIYLHNIKSKEELWKVTQYLYRINKHSLTLKCHQEDTEIVVHNNMRMGIGVTGYLQATEEQRSWLDETYRKLRAYDEEYSEKHGFPESIKLTTVKPSGTLSLLAGCTSGVHPGIYQYFIRRITMAADSELVSVCKQSGHKVEFLLNMDGTPDTNSVVVEFPCRYPDGTVLATELTAIDQLEYVKELQTNWSDNAVSCTVYYRRDELPAIRNWLAENYNNGVKTVSFLLHSDHGFKQAPFEEITAAEYEDLVSKTTPITSLSAVAEESFDLEDCSSGQCPVK